MAAETAPDESKRDGRRRRQGLVPSVAREIMTLFWIEAVVNPGGQSTSTARLQCSPSFQGRRISKWRDRKRITDAELRTLKAAAVILSLLTDRHLAGFGREQAWRS